MGIVSEIKAALDKVDTEHSAGPGFYDREWTRRIKEELGALGRRKGYYTYGLKTLRTATTVSSCSTFVGSTMGRRIRG